MAVRARLGVERLSELDALCSDQMAQCQPTRACSTYLPAYDGSIVITPIRLVAGLIGVPRGMFAKAIGAGFHPQVRHVSHNDQVDDEDTGVDQRRSANQLHHLERYIYRARYQGEPLSPCASMPERARGL